MFYLSPIGFIRVRTRGQYVNHIGLAYFDDEKECLTDTAKEAVRQLDEYFNHKRSVFDLKFELSGTDFQKSVYQKLMTIPYGKTVSYKDVAVMVGKASASRAVGSANHNNKLMFIVPCHRVTSASGKTSGTSDWQRTQQWLIDFEKENN